MILMTPILIAWLHLFIGHLCNSTLQILSCSGQHFNWASAKIRRDWTTFHCFIYVGNGKIKPSFLMMSIIGVSSWLCCFGCFSSVSRAICWSFSLVRPCLLLFRPLTLCAGSADLLGDRPVCFPLLKSGADVSHPYWFSFRRAGP